MRGHQLHLARQGAADPARSRASCPSPSGASHRPEADDETPRSRHQHGRVADDPLWYKDAIIYQLHVKSFFDCQQRRHRRFPRPDRTSSTTSPSSASTRSGCCRSIRRRAATTATTSPTIAACIPTTARSPTSRRFIRAAHARGLRVITELVINHTSDQHPWFQRARHAKPGSPCARLLCLVRQRPEIRRHAHHLPRHRELELDLGPGRRRLLLAPLLFAPARSEFRQSAGARGGAERHALLAATSASTACGSTPCPTWSSARARTTRTCRRPTRS